MKNLWTFTCCLKRFLFVLLDCKSSTFAERNLQIGVFFLFNSPLTASSITRHFCELINNPAVIFYAFDCFKLFGCKIDYFAQRFFSNFETTFVNLFALNAIGKWFFSVSVETKILAGLWCNNEKWTARAVYWN